MALLEAAGASQVEEVRARAPRLGTAPFDSERKRMSTLHPAAAGYTLMVKGAPEEVIARSDRLLEESGSERPLDDGLRRLLLEAAEDRARDGMQVLALARRDLRDVPATLDGAEQASHSSHSTPRGWRQGRPCGTRAGPASAS